MTVNKRKAEVRKAAGVKAARREVLKAQTQEDYRQRLDLGKTIGAINGIEQNLRDHANGREGKVLHDPQAMRWVLESKWKRLGKLMPDLKAVETSGSNELIVRIEKSYD